MNIIEILINTPKGTKLYSTIFGEVTFVSCQSNKILVSRHDDIVDAFFYDGKYMKEGECVLFPSKENRDWSKFITCPFKDGDIISKTYSDGTKYIAVFSHIGGIKPEVVNYHCFVRGDGRLKVGEDYGIGIYTEFKFASVEEREFLFKNLLENGYCWDTCIKKVKPLHLKFKVGDTISKKDYPKHTIVAIEEDRYRMKNGFFLMFTDQHEWEIVKFDIKELKPFDRVIVRDNNIDTWRCELYSHYRTNVDYYKHVCSSDSYHQCIPYNDDTKYLVGTTNDCKEYYKTWE